MDVGVDWMRETILLNGQEKQETCVLIYSSLICVYRFANTLSCPDECTGKYTYSLQLPVQYTSPEVWLQMSQ